MTVNVTKPQINLREKISELSGIVSYDKLPLGTCINIAEYTSANNTGSIDLNFPSVDEDYLLDPSIFYYKRDPGSILYVEYTWAVRNFDGYMRESLHFDHTRTSAWSSDIYADSELPYGDGGGSGQDDAEAVKTEYKKAKGAINGYVHGPGGASGITTTDYRYVNRSFSAFIWYTAPTVAIAFGIGVDSTGNTMTLRDDKYAGTRAIVMEFKR